MHVRSTHFGRRGVKASEDPVVGSMVVGTNQGRGATPAGFGSITFGQCSISPHLCPDLETLAEEKNDA